MLIVESIRKIRQAYHRDKKPIRQIAREFHVSKNTVKKIIRSDITEQVYQRTEQPRPKLSQYEDRLKELLVEDSLKPIRHRRSAQLLFEQLQREGFSGGYDSVRRYIKQQSGDSSSGTGAAAAFVPLSFDPGDAFQFDWSYEQIELGGFNVKIKVAQFRLCNSRMPFCIAYTRETLEMVLDAHVKAFSFFGGACRRGIYDNLKTVVTKVLMGKDRIFNRRLSARSPSRIWSSIIESPTTRRMKHPLPETQLLSRLQYPSISSTANVGWPALTLPTMGILVAPAPLPTTTMLRELPSRRWIYPFCSSASR